jgi:hypothetical protein
MTVPVPGSVAPGSGGASIYVQFLRDNQGKDDKLKKLLDLDKRDLTSLFKEIHKKPDATAIFSLVEYIEKGSEDVTVQKKIQEIKNHSGYSDVRNWAVNRKDVSGLKELFKSACQSGDQKLAETILKSHKIKGDYQTFAEIADRAGNIKFAKKAYYKSLPGLQRIRTKYFQKSTKTTMKVVAQISPDINIGDVAMKESVALKAAFFSGNRDSMKQIFAAYPHLLKKPADQEKFIELSAIFLKIPAADRAKITDDEKKILFEKSLSGTLEEKPIPEIKQILSQLSYKINAVPEEVRLLVLRHVLNKVATDNMDEIIRCLQTLQNNKDPKDLLDELQPFF